MAASFRKIDYSLRPAKYAERKMFVELLRRLAPFQAVEDYSYIGFGSVWFSDFILFHKTLGIQNMVSIEQSEGSRARFEANRPFQIRLEFGPASRILPNLNWQNRAIVWLDYDDPLAASMLYDVRTVSTRAKSGSILAVSMQCVKAPALIDYEQEDDPASLCAIDRFRQTFGRERVPDSASDDDLAGWPYGALSRTIIKNEIESALADRNVDPATGLRFLPICEFEYQDDARMTTLVGIFVAPDEVQTYEACSFDRVDFIPIKDKPVRIVMPKLTVRELRHIEQQLPIIDGTELSLGAIPSSDANQFSRMYRYFPNFAVLDA